MESIDFIDFYISVLLSKNTSKVASEKYWQPLFVNINLFHIYDTVIPVIFSTFSRF